jgi:hypothetical protein
MYCIHAEAHSAWCALSLDAGISGERRLRARGASSRAATARVSSGSAGATELAPGERTLGNASAVPCLERWMRARVCAYMVCGPSSRGAPPPRGDWSKFCGSNVGKLSSPRPLFLLGFFGLRISSMRPYSRASGAER